eukprot:2725086-Lingulodinium_polyedra.AAC.1
MCIRDRKTAKSRGQDSSLGAGVRQHFQRQKHDLSTTKPGAPLYGAGGPEITLKTDGSRCSQNKSRNVYARGRAMINARRSCKQTYPTRKRLNHRRRNAPRGHNPQSPKLARTWIMPTGHAAAWPVACKKHALPAAAAWR